ncbi:Uncharacterised protein [Mycobacterium tuberculosis]|nr:Uncharacterised protein [Mycobacterium tuberculosis]
MLPKEVAVCPTSPKSICPANNRGAWMTHGNGTIVWLTDRFHPLNAMLRRT